MFTKNSSALAAIIAIALSAAPTLSFAGGSHGGGDRSHSSDRDGGNHRSERRGGGRKGGGHGGSQGGSCNGGGSNGGTDGGTDGGTLPPNN